MGEHMGNKQVIAVGVRILSIALIVYILKFIPTIFTDFETGLPVWTNYYSLGFVFGVLIIAGILWTFPQSITNKIIPKDINVDELKIEKDSVLSLGFIILGIYFLFYTIGDMIFWGFVLLGGGQLGLDNKVNFLITIIELGICLFLIFGSRGVANLILKLRGR